MVKLKSATYGFCVMLAMLKELGAEYESIKELTEAIDNISNDMGCKPNLSPMTKYNVIYDLEKSGLIVFYRKKHSDKTENSEVGVQGSNIKVGLEIEGRVEKFIVKLIESADLEEDEKDIEKIKKKKDE